MYIYIYIVIITSCCMDIFSECDLIVIVLLMYGGFLKQKIEMKLKLYCTFNNNIWLSEQTK